MIDTSFINATICFPSEILRSVLTTQTGAHVSIDWQL